MKKKILSAILSLCMLVMLLPISVQAVDAWSYPTSAPATPFNGGSGTISAPYEINTAQQLANLAYLVNNNTADSNNGNAKYSTLSYKLTADIVLNDVSNVDNWSTSAPTNVWTPIGKGTYAFVGNFDGNGNPVSGIYINSSSDTQGLFGNLGSGSSISNVDVVKSYVKGGDKVGGIAAETSDARVKNCHVSATVKGNNHVGGVVGSSTTFGIVSDCTNTGSISASGMYVGGITGTSGGTVVNCCNTGTVSGAYYVGGVTGTSNGTVVNCCNTGTVIGPYNIGGVVGINFRTVANCYNTGKVTGTINFAGGIVAFNNGGNDCFVYNCYNTGSVSGGSSNVGGVIGENPVNNTIADCYWLTSSAASAYGVNHGTATDYYSFSASSDILTLLNNWVTLKNSSTYNTWKVDGSTNGGYPIFDAAYVPPTTYAVSAATNGVTANGVTATATFGATPYAAGATATVTITLSGTATAAGTHTIGLTSAGDVGSITAPATVTKTVAANATPTDTFQFTFTMPATAVDDLVVTNSFVPATVPGAPTIGTATAGNAQATVSFTPPASNGGAAITGYTVTSTPGGITATGAGSPITVNGLTNGTAYTFKVTATNSAGTSAASGASNSVTPQAPAPSGGGSYTPPALVTRIDNGGSTTGTNLSQLVSGGKTLTVDDNNKGAKLVFDTEALKGISGQTSSDIKVEMKDVTPAHQESLPGKQVFSLTVSSGSGTITNFGGAVTVTLPYTLKDGETADEVTVWYLASDGTTTEIPCTYDPATKFATFTVTHFSLYVVGVPWNNPFTDVRENDWFYGAVEFVSQNGMMKGIAGTDFSPNTTVTRGMFVTILWRLENEPSATKTMSFTDVAANEWYAKAVAWAAENNIATGYSGKFNPDDALTREQLAAILYRYTAYKNYDVSATSSLSTYADKPSDWALSSVSWAVAEGLIKGNGSSLDPTGSATRAQAATILQRFIENMAK